MSATGAPRGYNFGGKRAQGVEDQITAIARENARRVKCDQCDLMILPENMERHVRICHDW